ncbi:MAG TPA: prepilin-type N-terminal cleavage/methylation domain-containing protein [Pyrinomonadaceae bacterium]|jgi:Tfp pilus assembly protein PilV|nr:prepilin-type N-terminal cleavage/methylation domain-containing protein [Pyrinomonadaceae bacterium]
MKAKRKKGPDSRRGEHGFTLIETTIGLVIMMIVSLGSASLFAYAVRNNAGGSDRAIALAIAQQALETLRNARYTVTVTDTLLQETTATPAPLTVKRNNRPFTLTTKIVNTTPTLKTITLTVAPQKAGTVWSGEPVTIVTQRARSDQP